MRGGQQGLDLRQFQRAYGVVVVYQTKSSASGYDGDVMLRLVTDHRGELVWSAVKVDWAISCVEYSRKNVIRNQTASI